ncbi:MAG: extracellular solute-binding protein, partial [Treponema sp.]|nr:extracellular solute-binding protein [Treponema sp.]
GYFGKDYQANDVSTSVMQLLQGKAGMFINGEWHAADMNNSPDIGVFYMKRPDGKDAALASSKQSYAMSVYSKGANKDMAIEFAKFFASADVQQLMGTVSTAVPGAYPAAAGKVSSDNPIIQAFMNPNFSELGYLDNSGSVQKTDVDFFSVQTAATQKLLFNQISVADMIKEYDGSVDYNNIIK